MPTEKCFYKIILKIQVQHSVRICLDLDLLYIIFLLKMTWIIYIIMEYGGAFGTKQDEWTKLTIKKTKQINKQKIRQTSLLKWFKYHYVFIKNKSYLRHIVYMLLYNCTWLTSHSLKSTRIHVRLRSHILEDVLEYHRTSRERVRDW